MIFMKDEWVLRRKMGGVIVCDQVGLDIMLTSNLSNGNTQFSLGDETRGRAFTVIGLLLEVLSLGG